MSNKNHIKKGDAMPFIVLDPAKLTALREAKNMTRAELARQLQILTWSQADFNPLLHRYETGKTSPDFEKTVLLCTVLNCKPMDIAKFVNRQVS